MVARYVAGLIPPEVLQICIDEAAQQYDSEVLWVRQQYDENGDPVENPSGGKAYDEPRAIPARQVTVDREFLDDEGFHVVLVTQWYLPPHTGVRYGDQVYARFEDPTAAPPIMSVSEVPSPNASIYELVTTGWRSKGAP